jgi:hypothetical protein
LNLGVDLSAPECSKGKLHPQRDAFQVLLQVLWHMFIYSKFTTLLVSFSQSVGTVNCSYMVQLLRKHTFEAVHSSLRRERPIRSNDSIVYHGQNPQEKAEPQKREKRQSLATSSLTPPVCLFCRMHFRKQGI